MQGARWAVAIFVLCLGWTSVRGQQVLSVSAGGLTRSYNHSFSRKKRRREKCAVNHAPSATAMNGNTTSCQACKRSMPLHPQKKSGIAPALPFRLLTPDQPPCRENERQARHIDTDDDLHVRQRLHAHDCVHVLGVAMHTRLVSSTPFRRRACSPLA